MKKSGILNSQLSRIVASMGHKDKLVVCDVGLPIPKNSEVVDLALTKNIPRFIETLKVVLEELKIEEAIIASEMIDNSNSIFEEISDILKDVHIQKVTHEQFKEITSSGKNISFIRTGEATPFANVILISGVTF